MPIEILRWLVVIVVLYSAATSVGIIDATTNAVLTATIIISMVLTPLAIIAFRSAFEEPGEGLDGIDEADGLTGSVLVIGFGAGVTWGSAVVTW